MIKIMSAREAVDLIKDNDTLYITGSGGGVMDADYVYEGIEQKFLETAAPKNLTLVHVTGIGVREGKGVNRFAHKGLVKRVIGGHWGWSPEMTRLAFAEEIEAYNLPQGILSLLSREIAAGRKGLFTTVGMKTFVDPRVEGGKLNKKAQENLVEICRVDGEELLYYKAFPVNVAIVRGTTADEDGNISVEQEAVNLDVTSAAEAAYNSGGIVIAQVKRVAKRGTLNPRQVKIPGFMVTAVVVNPGQWQTWEGEYNPSFSGEIRIPMDKIDQIPFNVRKIVARRGAAELKKGDIVNLGFGIADGVANIAAEEGLSDKITFTVEQGIIGGVPAKDDIFGAGWNPDMIIDAPYIFDFYHGGGLDISFLGLAQVDPKGNVNVSKFGKNIAGCGGFIDISQNVKNLVFCATFTAGGLKVDLGQAKLKIRQEGRVRKFIRQVEQITFSGEYAMETGQRVLYVTERAVFRLTPDGLELIEIAPGIDLEKDVLAQMDFKPIVSKSLKKMDPRIFRPEKMGLRF